MWERWRIEFNKKVKTTFGLQTRTGYKNITDSFFKLFKELHEAFNIPFDVDTDATHYNNEKLCRIAYHIENNELLENIELIGEKPSNIESMTTAWCKVRELADFKTEWCKVLRLKKYKGRPQTTKSLNETIWVGYFKMALGDILEYRSKK